MPISSSQFGSEQDAVSTPSAPLSYSSSTSGSAQQATAWSTKSLGNGRPLSWSKKTGGTTFKWDDASTPTMPASDKGVGRN